MVLWMKVLRHVTSYGNIPSLISIRVFFGKFVDWGLNLYLMQKI